MPHNKLIAFSIALVVVTLLSGAFLMSSVVSADDSTVDNVNITVPVSCSLEGTGMNTHNANIVNGTYQADIGTTTLKAYCNDNEGFAIYANGYTGNELGNNKLIGSSTNEEIVTGTVTSTPNPDISNWAMKLATSSGATYALTLDNGFSSYSSVPNTYTKVAHRDSGTDIGTGATGSTLTTTYAAYMSKTQAADTYSGQVIYTLVHPASHAAPTTSVSLDTATTLQDVTYCSGDLLEGQVYTLTDSRDNIAYHVARLADGNCWMLDNLALDPTDSVTATNMNTSNTNATTEAITNLLNGGSTTTGWSSVAVTDVDLVFDSYTAPMINNASKDTLVTSYGLAAINGQAKVGIYYNYCAASVGTYCYDEEHGLDVPDTLIDASQDLCPANWRMPTMGAGGEYNGLFSAYSTTQDATDADSLQYNLSTPLSGYYQEYNAYGQNLWGAWWSSSYHDNWNTNGFYGYMHYLDVTPDTVFEEYDYSRNNGLTIRCLLDN
jgi:hypothetical protein